MNDALNATIPAPRTKAGLSLVANVRRLDQSEVAVAVLEIETEAMQMLARSLNDWADTDRDAMDLVTAAAR